MTNDQAPMKGWKVTLLTILVLCVLAIATIPVFSQKIQQDLTYKAEQLLDQQSAQWASVEMDGRDAYLSGAGAEPGALEYLAEQMLGIDGVRVVGIRRTNADEGVDQAVEAAFAQRPEISEEEESVPEQTGEMYGTLSPYTLSVVNTDEQVSIKGNARDQETADRLVNHAQLVFAEKRIEPDWVLGGGQPETWENAAKTAIAQLARLDEGKVELEDSGIRIEGRALTTDVSDSVNSQLQLLKEDGYELTFEVEPDDKVLLTCQKDFTDLLKGRAIHFRTGRADIRNDSVELLNKLYEISSRCTQFDIEVAGHTDSRGGAARNKQLSLERAQSVVDWLAEKGLDVSRMTAIGHGEEHSVADNNTRSGRALNRRIEITVRGK